MISVIVCSKDAKKERDITAHYSTLFGDDPHEILVFNNPRSIAEAYNRGIDRSKGDALIFSHDDIEFLSPGTWLARLKKHLSDFDMVGLAGTEMLISAAWAQAGPPHTFGHVAELDGGQIGPFRVLICSVPSAAIPNMQAMDGLFLAANRRTAETVRFDDALFDGFHCYDVDFTFRAFSKNFRLAVVTDLPVLHHSQGHFDDRWAYYAQRFMQKHGQGLASLPPRPFQHALVGARSRAELSEIMTPSWLKPA